MYLSELRLRQFRNYREQTLEFDPGVNLIVGRNAQGKTNLLEAIAYLSSASSHRARYDKELIALGIDHAFIKGEIEGGGRVSTLEAALHRGSRRQLTRNGVRLKTAGELSGVFNTVLFYLFDKTSCIFRTCQFFLKCMQAKPIMNTLL